MFNEVGAISGKVCRKLAWGYWWGSFEVLYTEVFRDVEYVGF